MKFIIKTQMARENRRRVWVGRDFKTHLVPTPCHWQGHLPVDLVALPDSAWPQTLPGMVNVHVLSETSVINAFRGFLTFQDASKALILLKVRFAAVPLHLGCGD